MSTDTNARIGIAGLNAQHHARWAAGLCSFREVGEELGGIRPQTVAKAFQHRGWRKDNGPAVEPVKPAQPSKPDERLTEPEREKMANIAHKRLLMGAMILADEATTGLQAARGKHSASSLNAYARVLRQAAELLTGLLYPPPLDDSESLSELRVRVLTDDEHKELKLAGERGDEDGFDDDLDDLDEDVSEPNNGLGTAAGACVTRPSLGSGGTPDRCPDTSASAPESVSSAPALVWTLPPLPDRSGFRSWLEQLSASHGRCYVREIATAVSRREIGVGVDLDEVIAVVVHATGGDPIVLRDKLDKLSTMTA